MFGEEAAVPSAVQKLEWKNSQSSTKPGLTLPSLWDQYVSMAVNQTVTYTLFIDYTKQHIDKSQRLNEMKRMNERKKAD